jgi:hypothetical protein
MKQSWPTQHFRLLWRPSKSPYQAAMGRPLEGFQKVLEKTPPAPGNPLQMNQSNTNAINEYNQNGNRALLSLLG